MTEAEFRNAVWKAVEAAVADGGQLTVWSDLMTATTDQITALARQVWGEATIKARPESEWHEDDGEVLWWTFPICEAPWVGSPLDDGWPHYHTHWTQLPAPPQDPTPGASLKAGEVSRG